MKRKGKKYMQRVQGCKEGPKEGRKEGWGSYVLQIKVKKNKNKKTQKKGE